MHFLLKMVQKAPHSDHPHVQGVEKRAKTISATVHDQIKLKLTAGFELVEVITGFESTWVIVGNIPTHITEAAIRSFVDSFGQVLELHVSSINLASSKTAKARYATIAEAVAACAFNFTRALGAKLTIRLPVNNSRGENVIIQDASVLLEWEVPHKTVYAGYASLKTANEAIAVAQKLFQARYVRADHYVAIPSLDLATVRFRYMNFTVENDVMRFFMNPTHVAWTRLLYEDLEGAIRSVRRVMVRNGGLLSFNIMPPPYKDGITRGWANYATTGDAKAAAASAGNLYVDDMKK